MISSRVRCPTSSSRTRLNVSSAKVPGEINESSGDHGSAVEDGGGDGDDDSNGGAGGRW